MKHSQYFQNQGVTVHLGENGGVKIKGLSSLPGEDQKRVVEYAKIHKREILLELQPIPIISKMKTCLHGSHCYNLILKNDRQVCRRSGQPIFDMDSCPDGRWFKPKDPGSILWEQAWALATWIDDNSETGAPIEERRARLPELMAMIEQMEHSQPQIKGLE